jgi:hypothetical protein
MKSRRRYLIPRMRELAFEKRGLLDGGAALDQRNHHASRKRILVASCALRRLTRVERQYESVKNLQIVAVER